MFKKGAIVSWASHDVGLANIQFNYIDSLHQVIYLGTVINSRVAMLLQTVQYCVLFSVNTNIGFKRDPFIFTVVQCDGQLALCTLLQLSKS
jgi:hypothetical protein